MKKIAPRSLLGILLMSLAGLFSGCAWANYHAYEGGQQKWPIAAGAFVDHKYAIPVYYGPPARPYRVVGFIDATTAPIRRNGVVAFAARRAKEKGADAIVVAQEGSELAGSVSTMSGTTTTNFSGNVNPTGGVYGFGNAYSLGSATSVGLYRGKAQVIAVKWL